MADFYETFDIATTSHGIELTVRDAERADEFDDFLNEVCDITTYRIHVKDGWTFGFESPFTVEDVRALVERFKAEKPM